jgi:hypothetical protein
MMSDREDFLIQKLVPQLTAGTRKKTFTWKLQSRSGGTISLRADFPKSKVAVSRVLSLTAPDQIELEVLNQEGMLIDHLLLEVQDEHYDVLQELFRLAHDSVFKIKETYDDIFRAIGG